MRLLLIEDDKDLVSSLKCALEKEDYAVDDVSDGIVADRLLRTENFDLIVLDLSLPRRSGLEILRRFRNRGNQTPILILSAHTELDDRVEGLDLGADDYLNKPFELSELEARLRALLRRSQGNSAPVTKLGQLEYDSTSRRIFISNQELTLPRRELCLFEILLNKQDRVVSKESIMDQLYNLDEIVGLNAVEIYIHRLRKKLTNTGINIRTVRGLGYLLEYSE